MIGRDTVTQKLAQVLGKKTALDVVAKTMSEAGLEKLDCADDQLRFANALIPRGGLYEAVGRALKIQAILNGGHDEERITRV
ncbi:MAG: hypothetical protein H6718_04320 [Polyangiaceae bacterium]|nr:hypothetical protein [Polyangiaceae bacterium]